MNANETALNLADRSQTHPVRECKYCGADIAWIKSKRTGKHYPANVYRLPSESAYRSHNVRVAPWDVHTREKCEANKAAKAEAMAEMFPVEHGGKRTREQAATWRKLTTELFPQVP